MFRGVELLLQTLLTGRSSESWLTLLLRLGFYFMTLVFRGFVLHKFLNGWEDQMIHPPDECWFRGLAKRARGCHGLQFDFSDHTVLYLGSILPIPFMELVHGLLMPLFSNQTWLSIKSVILMSGMAYLYVIALGEEFKTAAYYHSRGEIVVGFLISLIVQLPYALLQSSTFPSLSGARYWLYGIPKSPKHNND